MTFPANHQPPLSGSDATALDEHFMRRALTLAQQAGAEDEVPVGAVLVLDGRIVGEGYNRPRMAHDPTAHAEIGALRNAAQALGNYRLPGSTLYVTIEPCTMCIGAIIHARVERLVFGAPEPKYGAVVSQPVLQPGRFNHQLQVASGVLADECADLMSAFFRSRRQARQSDV